MKNKITCFFLLIGFSFVCVHGAQETSLQPQSGVLDAVRGKIALEAQLEQRLSSMLKSYLKTEDLSVIVKVNLLLSKMKEGGSSMRKWDGKEEIVLPGVPASTSMTKDNTRASAGDKAVRVGISSINIWLMTGEALSKETETKMKKLISDALDLDAAAGDTITVEKMTKEGFFLKNAIWKIDTWIIVVFVFLIALAVFLYGPFRGFLKKFNENVSALISSKTAAASGEASSGGAVTAAEAALSAELSISGAGGGGGTSVLTFDSSDTIPLEKYVNKDNVEDLNIILENETPEVIAKVAQHLPPKLAFAAIPKHKMNDVVERFFKREYEEPETVKNLLNRIRDKMAGSFGGEARLSRLIQVMDKKSQKGIMAFIRGKNTVFAAVIESYFFKFTDLLCYEEASLRRIFRKSGVEAFARCLSLCDEEVQKSFFDLLGPAIKDLITSRMQTMVHVTDAGDSELAILKAIETLSATGLLLSLMEVKQLKGIKKDIPPAPPPAKK